MDSTIEKDNKAEPYELDEMIFDGQMDKDRLLATLEKKYKEEMEKKQPSPN